MHTCHIHHICHIRHKQRTSVFLLKDSSCRCSIVITVSRLAPMKVAAAPKKKRGKAMKAMKQRDGPTQKDRPAHKQDERKGDRHKRDEFGRKICRGPGGPLCPWGHVLSLSCGTCAQQKGEEEGTKGGFLLDCKKCGYYACVCDLRFHDFFK